MSEKTEAPTARRLRRARQEGDVAVSAALGQAVAFVVALALLPTAATATAWRVAARLVDAIHDPVADGSATWVVGDVLALSVPLLLAAAAVGTVTGMVQTGGVVTLKKLAPDLSRANPFVGLKNLVNAQRLLAVVRSLVAALLVGWLAVRALLAHGADLGNSVGDPMMGAAVGGVLVREIAWLAALVGLALAALDLLVTRHSWWQRLKMTRDEVKRDHREAEGDPEQKGARHRAHQEVLAGATLASVRKATVVVVNPTHLASALRYEESDDEAPLVLAQGRGELAQRIIDEARAHGIPVVRDVPVAHALADLEVGERIPEALFEAVAEILREIWEHESRSPDSPGEEQERQSRTSASAMEPR